MEALYNWVLSDRVEPSEVSSRLRAAIGWHEAERGELGSCEFRFWKTPNGTILEAPDFEGLLDEMALRLSAALDTEAMSFLWHESDIDLRAAFARGAPLELDDARLGEAPAAALLAMRRDAESVIALSSTKNRKQSLIYGALDATMRPLFEALGFTQGTFKHIATSASEGGLGLQYERPLGDDRLLIQYTWYNPDIRVLLGMDELKPILLLVRIHADGKVECLPFRRDALFFAELSNDEHRQALAVHFATDGVAALAELPDLAEDVVRAREMPLFRSLSAEYAPRLDAQRAKAPTS